MSDTEPATKEKTGSQLVLDALVDEGVETVFGYPGGAIMPLYDALFSERRIVHVLVRHEQGAAFAAGGYARSSGKVGVAMATSGPGATNLITGILDAHMDSVPVVAITGQVRTAIMGTDGFQEADVTSIAQPCTKRAFLVRRVEDVYPTVREAFALARGPRPGAVLVDIPQDVLKAKTAAATTTAPPSPPPALPSESAIEEAARILASARRPLVIAGGGVRSANAVAAYRELLTLLRCPHAATINALGACDPADKNFIGMLGMHGTKRGNRAVNACDVIVALGMRFDDRVTGRVDRFARQATILHFDIDATEFGKIVNPAVAVRGCLGDTLPALVRAMRAHPPRSYAEWFEELAQHGASLPVDRADDGHMSATTVLDRFFATVPASAIVTTDVGQHQMWAAQRQHVDGPQRFITSAGLGAMGFGFPAAIGAKLAHPEATVCAIVGDGGFQMTMNEMVTMMRYQAPVKILLIDNRRLGMVRQWQQLFYDRRYSATDLSDNPDFVMIARAMGVPGRIIERAEDLDAGLCALFHDDGPMLLHCACFPHENVWPMIPAGAALDDLIEAAPA
ncbi:MAG: biosynthetic-type acetolactate synthase large subunit [Candidatus Eremiobacteraeota bacterium]|nr:biosynthetic-type acetolactate synthase large subunit [Candidatus Eremiobacteraeota bacterium]MBV8356135.1 biosynthetic-type acetolactate synthase large subunit [Candidatus Eremiobacteraeota bacterium]